MRKEALQGQHGNITSRRDEAGSQSRPSRAGVGGQPGSGRGGRGGVRQQGGGGSRSRTRRALSHAEIQL